MKEHGWRFLSVKTAEENETRKKQKGESQKPSDFGVLNQGSHVTAKTNKHRKGNSVCCTAASGRFYEKVKDAWWEWNPHTHMKHRCRSGEQQIYRKRIQILSRPRKRERKTEWVSQEENTKQVRKQRKSYWKEFTTYTQPHVWWQSVRQSQRQTIITCELSQESERLESSFGLALC